MREALIALGGLCAFAALILYPQLVRMHAVPDLGDPLFSIWRIGWVYRQLLGDPRPLFDANIFYPERLTLTFSDAMLLPSLVASPLLAARFHPVVVYNILLVGSFILSGWTMYLLVRRVSGSHPAAFVSGLVFGFYPYRFEHYSHLELQMTALMPLALLALHRFTDRFDWRWLALAAVLGAGQLYCSLYYGVFFALYASVVFGIWLAAARRQWTLSLAAQLIAASALYGALAAPLVRPYLQSGEVRKGRGEAEVAHFSATPMDFLRANVRSATWSAVTPPGRREERQLFPGLMVIGLAVLGMIPPIGRVRLGVIAGMLLAFDASLGVNGLVYPWLYEWLPPVRSMRVPARFSILFGLSLAILAGFGVRKLIHGRSPAWRRATVCVAIAGVAVDVWPVLRLEEVWPSPPSFYAALAEQPGVVLAEFPAGGPPQRFPAMPYLYFSLWHWRPLINGYSGYHPQSYTDLLDTLERFPEPDTIRALQARGVTHVTVNCALFREAGYGERCERVLQAAAATPELREMTRVRWEGAAAVVFELRR